MSEGSSKEQEIAALEEQLRLLKEEDEKNKISDENQVVSNNEGGGDEQAYLGRLTPDIPTPMNEMLSESWKEENEASSADNENGIVSSLIKVGGAVLLIISLALASQVPVGQEDFSKYSYKNPTSSSIDLGDLNPVKSVKTTAIALDDVTPSGDTVDDTP
eukprot:CAMPEP_0197826492 /NCGR_PEP_ID=MMETSP1437-20131217/3451_1 /TAXON_ID=49252 ORGANISM="Eucampia antarctica, Strain CCMP1452" /NCGR_SAMPLE_ID=MMETSP1437 /ASSEMBLY_ACC=CAM_ASM_001096 /LENGTH=159 /DNA_ID=CAMNT_0043426961 /DNA_START=215 /DNA_END=694 /DNA_ORIENTATION=-